MHDILDLIIKWVVPFILTTIASGAIAYSKGRYQRASDREKAIEEGLQSLLRAEIIRANDKYMGQGFCPVYAKEALKRAYQAYHTLGGNDVATKLYEDVMKLPEYRS